jgi:hypothetical protein
MSFLAGKITLIVGAAAMAMGLAGGLGIGRMHGERAVNRLHAAHALERAQAARTALQAEQAARAEERRRVHTVTEIADAAHLQAAAARADAVRADRAARELRHAYLAVAVAIASGGTANTTTAGGGAPATGPGLVLADVLGWADSPLRDLAAALDQSRIAGQACERAYDGLTQ